MKNRIILVSTITIILFACNKSSKENTATPNPTQDSSQVGLSTSAETKPPYDNTTFGVYKGVIVGSSGTIIFKINNGDSIVKGYLSVDDQKDTLSTTYKIVPGQALSNVSFVGKISSMKVSVHADGSNASLTNIQILGHNNVTGFIIHENSTMQVLCYEGTFTGNASGIINATRVGVNSLYDSAYFLTKVQSVNDTNLYRGFGAIVHDTTRAALYYGGQIQFNILGIFNTGDFNPNTFGGYWTGGYGSGQFITHRTY